MITAFVTSDKFCFRPAGFWATSVGGLVVAVCVGLFLVFSTGSSAAQTAKQVTLNRKADGYWGIWYMNQPSSDEYVYKYSGGMGTYCAKHKPFAIYCEKVNRTFFCYGGADENDNQHLLQMVSYFDHTTGTVPRPTILLDKQTNDAHDNPVLSIDAEGHIWVFSTSHGTSRPLVRDYEAEGLNVYLKDIRYDDQDNPVLLYLTSRGYESGPQNDPRTWTITRRDGTKWVHSTVTRSDNNYDMGELWVEDPNEWKIIAPTENGPQEYNPGGEVAMWTSNDRGATWKLKKQLTTGSPMNHTYVRRSVGGHPGFVALWADGHGRQPSASSLYFCDTEGNVFRLPPQMETDHVRPIPVTQ